MSSNAPQPVAVRAATVLDYLFPAATGLVPADAARPADAGTPEGGETSVFELGLSADGLERPVSAASGVVAPRYTHGPYGAVAVAVR